MSKLVTIQIEKSAQAIGLRWSNGAESIIRGQDEFIKVLIHQSARGLKLVSIIGPEKEIGIKCDKCGKPIHVWDCEIEKKGG